MKSCKFSSLPLAQVALSFRSNSEFMIGFGGPDFWKYSEIAHKLRERFPNFVSGQFGGMGIPLPVNQGLRLSNSTGSLIVSLSDTAIEVQFQPVVGEKYAGFQNYLNVAAELYDLCGRPDFKIVSVSYTNIYETEKELWQVLAPKGFEHGGLQEYIELNVVRRVSDRLDYRIQAGLDPNGTKVIVTTGGTYLQPGENPLEVMEFVVHDQMQDEFMASLTQEVKDEWGFTGIIGSAVNE